MDFKELFKFLLLIISMVLITFSLVLLFGEIRPEYPEITFYVVKLLGLVLGLSAWKTMKFLGLLQWLDKQ